MDNKTEPATKPNLLVVEDDFENRKLIEVCLRNKFNIRSCDSDESFYEELNKNDFDIFLLDIYINGTKNGLELVKELRESPKYLKVPILCISAHVFPEDRLNAFNAGVDEFLARPIRNNEMLEEILRVYKRKTGKEI